MANSNTFHALGYELYEPYRYHCLNAQCYRPRTERAAEVYHIVYFPVTDTADVGESPKSAENLRYVEESFGFLAATTQYAEEWQRTVAQMRTRFDQVLRQRADGRLIARKIPLGLAELSRISHLRFVAQRLEDEVLPQIEPQIKISGMRSLLVFGRQSQDGKTVSLLHNHYHFLTRTLGAGKKLLDLFDSVYDRQLQVARSLIDARTQSITMILAWISLALAAAAILTESYRAELAADLLKLFGR